MSTYGAVLEALADQTRRDILSELRHGPAAVQTLADQVPVSRPAVSQHLRVLRDAGLVQFESEGTRNLYRLERAGFDALARWLDDFWDDVLNAFEFYANDPSTKRGTT